MTSAKESDGLSKAFLKNKNIKLIKVPKFVSNKWLNYNHKDIVGLFEQNNNSEISTLYIQKDDSDKVKKLTCNKNNTVNTYILKQNKVSLKPSKSTNQSNSNASDTTYENSNQSKGKININNPVKESTERNKEVDYVICADIIKNCEHTYSFLPILDEDYSLVLKERHYNTNVKKNRFTIIETRNEENIDSTQTLFKYYTTDDNIKNENNKDNKYLKNNSSTTTITTTSNNNKRMLFESDNNLVSSSASKQKLKQAKKMQVFDLDKTKISMFKIFEKEGKKGVPFSIFTKSFNIPSNYLKNILEEIAVKRKRLSDKKSVYYLKDYVS
ncbi:transcription initiation factor IIF subunit beta, putative [Plasmodium malariae]|uniref:Transcription initiation factor IIF subunit beta, putative n=1 Tax=Plasmodium malariae TaxID=5858 RepID=A0A1D3PCG5_PLAMA|nr:transcription initiation factor IIF subunit beta, putative [Plasmodium malariae]SCN12961.1 transcription initiation factor IIF subunit beta, putative [Plasmodium malariae]